HLFLYTPRLPSPTSLFFFFHAPPSSQISPLSLHDALPISAGACVAASATVSKRRRLPSSAWDQLSLVGAEEEEWADSFRAYSRTRSRLASGIDRGVADKVVFDLMDLAARFLEMAETGTHDFDGVGGQAA